MQSNNNETDQPAVAWFTDLIPDFPLEADELLVTTDDDGIPNRLLIPDSLSPARHSPERDRFFVEFKAFEILDHDKGHYRTPPSPLYESSDTIDSFETLVAHGQIIKRNKWNVHHTTPAEAKTAGD